MATAEQYLSLGRDQFSRVGHTGRFEWVLVSETRIMKVGGTKRERVADEGFFYSQDYEGTGGKRYFKGTNPA